MYEFEENRKQTNGKDFFPYHVQKLSVRDDFKQLTITMIGKEAYNQVETILQRVFELPFSQLPDLRFECDLMPETMQIVFKDDVQQSLSTLLTEGLISNATHTDILDQLREAGMSHPPR